MENIIKFTLDKEVVDLFLNLDIQFEDAPQLKINKNTISLERYVNKEVKSASRSIIDNEDLIKYFHTCLSKQLNKSVYPLMSYRGEIVKYIIDDFVAPHRDYNRVYKSDCIARTVVFYLKNTTDNSGHTIINDELYDCKSGDVLIFNKDLIHSAAKILKGEKIVFITDIFIGNNTTLSCINCNDDVKIYIPVDKVASLPELLEAKLNFNNYNINLNMSSNELEYLIKLQKDPFQIQKDLLFCKKDNNQSDEIVALLNNTQKFAATEELNPKLIELVKNHGLDVYTIVYISINELSEFGAEGDGSIYSYIEPLIIIKNETKLVGILRDISGYYCEHKWDIDVNPNGDRDDGDNDSIKSNKYFDIVDSSDLDDSSDSDDSDDPKDDVSKLTLTHRLFACLSYTNVLRGENRFETRIQGEMYKFSVDKFISLWFKYQLGNNYGEHYDKPQQWIGGEKKYFDKMYKLFGNIKKNDSDEEESLIKELIDYGKNYWFKDYRKKFLTSYDWDGDFRKGQSCDTNVSHDTFLDEMFNGKKYLDKKIKLQSHHSYNLDTTWGRDHSLDYFGDVYITTILKKK